MAKKTTRLSEIPIFSQLSKAEINKIDALMTRTTISANTEFIKEGTAGREAFLIISGSATIRRGSNIIATLQPGDFVGEMAVVAGIPRTASAIANEELVVEVLNRREFSSLLDNSPQITKKVMVGALKRLHEIAPGIVT